MPKPQTDIDYAPIVRIITTNPSHIAALKLNLRSEDATELLRLGVTIQHALWQSYRQSLIRKTALIDNTVAACWGVCGTVMGRVGVPWLLTSPAIHNISPLRFAREYQREVMAMLKIFPRLENYVDSEYAGAIRLLEIIGFTIEGPQKIGNGMYCKFWVEA